VSKDLLSGGRVDETRLLLQSSEAYEDAAIDLRLGARATDLDVRARRVELGDGSQLAYDRLVLAVGGEPVRPPRLTTRGRADGARAARGAVTVRIRSGRGYGRSVHTEIPVFIWGCGTGSKLVKRRGSGVDESGGGTDDGLKW
jgi:NADPH-dependent 2,4-dienoyl-CoA reductase/sulfur reductase-like enzyme